MAQITKDHMQRTEKNNQIQGIVECKYSTFIRNGEKYIQFNTYGSPDRIFTDSASQTIQFSEDTAQFLIELFEEVFK